MVCSWCLEQWGQYHPATNWYSAISYPISFGSQVYQIVTGYRDNNGRITSGNGQSHASGITTSNFKIWSEVDSANVAWIAVGK